ncbi:MAG: hypothetical protein LAO03_15590 [Acidobacteriia bacterium]|nr:hypothetical protein [Terriglobia bacterium]
MKSWLTIVLLLAAAYGQGVAPSPQSIPVDQENARKAKTLLDQMVQALGGPAYLGIQDISREGRTYSFHLGQPNSVGTLFWQFYQYPDKDRYELTKKRDVIEIFNGDKSYEITFKGTHAQDPKELGDYLRRRRYALDYVIRGWLSEPGIALFYEGPTVAEQKSVEQVTLMNKRNEGVTLFIDGSTHLPVKKTFTWRDPTDKQRNVEDEVYDNYRPVQGVMTPFSVTRFYNGEMSNQRFLTAVSYNRGVSPSLFEASLPDKNPARH